MSKEIKSNSFHVEVEEEDFPTITEITWKNQGGNLEKMILSSTSDSEVFIFDDDCGDSVEYYRKDLPKILKAVEKAIELGWHKV